MKKIAKYKLFFVVTLFGCTTLNNPNPKSKWVKLEDAKPALCYAWPKRKQDLDIKDIHVITGEKSHGLISTGRSRNTRPIQYFAPFDGSPKISGTNLTELDWGVRFSYLGGFMRGGRPYAFLQQAKSGGKGSLEVRDVLTNVVQFSSPWIGGSLARGRVTHVKDGAWLHYKKEREGVDEAAIDDIPSHVTFVAINRKAKSIKLQEYPGVAIEGQPYLYPVNDEADAVAVWLDEGTSEAVKKPTFKWLKLTGSGKATDPKALEIAVDESVESWSSRSLGDYLYITYVDGDSLLGDAKLHVVAIQWRNDLPRVIWNTEVGLDDMHVAQPKWAKGRDNLYIVLPTWMDRESTLSVFKVDPDGLSEVRPNGVFREGTTFIRSFIDSEEKTLNVILKRRKVRLPGFSLCQFDL